MNRITLAVGSLIGSLAALALSPQVHASAGADLCASAQLKALKITGADSSSPNYCRAESLDEVPPHVQALVAQIARLNAKAAALFGVPVDTLLDKSDWLKLEVKSDPSGWMISSAEITMGVFPDWSSGSINVLTYLHELGHVLSKIAKGTNGVPAVAQAYSNKLLFRESFADLVALEIGGGIASPEADSPACFANFRATETNTSFQLPIGNFDYFMGTRAFLKCCEAPRDARDSDAAYAHLQAACADYHVKNPEPLPDFNQTPLHSKAKTRDLDPHQLGLPLNAFIQDLAAALGQRRFALYLDALRAVEQDKTAVTPYTCQLSGPASLQTAPEDLIHLTTRPRFKSFLAALKKPFIALGKEAEFDALWSKRGMSIAEALGEQLDGVPGLLDEQAALTKIAERLYDSESKSTAYGPGSPCRDPNGGLAADCRVVCAKD